MSVTTEQIHAQLLKLASERGQEKTFCPSEAAKQLATDWRPLMDAVRAEAARMCDSGLLVCTQKGEPAHPLKTKGAVRLALRG